MITLLLGRLLDGLEGEYGSLGDATAVEEAERVSVVEKPVMDCAVMMSVSRQQVWLVDTENLAEVWSWELFRKSLNKGGIDQREGYKVNKCSLCYTEFFSRKAREKLK